MEAFEGINDVVHPEVRAHISSLVSALGGNSADYDGQYKLGDDALEVLRDIKKWIRFYDEKTNRMDVARCLAEANLIGGDLLQILATWPENLADNKFKARIALACYEIMTPLTWPIEKDAERTTVNHYRHMPVLQLAQLGYKRDIINFDGAQILHTAIRVALPSMAIPIGDRTPRDQGIIKLVLYFLRNVAMITPPPGVKYDGDESQISRSALIDAFSYQDIFLAILTIASNMGDDFRTEDVVIMEIIFHLVKRVDIEKLFLDEEDLGKAKAEELTALIKKEKAMLQSYNRRAPTRHNRFGTMVWVQRADGRMSAISGQDALRDAATRERKMDSTKTFRPPRRARKAEMEPKDLGPPVSLNARANKQLRCFVEEFLDSGFNPLFQHIRKTIDREAPYLLHQHRAQFFYLVAWFLEAERVRIKSAAAKRKASHQQQQQEQEDQVSPFNLVAGVLNQETFITLTRAMDRSYGDKDWQELTTVMRCFTQILLTVQEMSDSGGEENEEIAENILNRLFYEESTHDAVANIVRTYKDQGFEYLDASTELAHTYLRILEAYSKQNVDMQVRSRKRTRRKKKAAKASAVDDGDGAPEGVHDMINGEGDDSADDEASAERVSKERKFDFKRFAARFLPQGVVDTFVRLTAYYRDLNEGQLKRAHRYLHRVAFKQDMSVMLFRVDIIHLLYNMIKGPDPLDRSLLSAGAYRDWEELVRQILRRCVRKLEERPELLVEMLFSKIGSTAHYLEYGYDKQTLSSGGNPRPGAELEFKHPVDADRQVAIAVGVLLDRSMADHVGWVKGQLGEAESERRAWETAERAMPSVEEGVGSGAGVGAGAEGSEEEQQPADSADAQMTKEHSVFMVRPDSDARRTTMFKNPHLRLLMRLVGFERLAPSLDETPDSVWVIPARLGAEELKESIDYINAAEFSPPVFDNDESAEQQLRRKSAARKKKKPEGDDLDDDDDADMDMDDEFLFPAGGPTARKADDGDLDGKKGKRKLSRRKTREGSATELTEEQLQERAWARRDREREKARRVKSDARVHSSDDEDDPEADAEFFAAEKVRQAARESLYSRLERRPGDIIEGGDAKKEKAILLSDGSDGEDNALLESTLESMGVERVEKRQGRKRKSDALLDDGENDEDDVEEEDGSSQSDGSTASSLKHKKKQKQQAPAKVSKPLFKRPRKKAAAFVISSDEEDSGGDDDDVGAAAAGGQPSSQTSTNAAQGDDSDEVGGRDAMETDDTPLSSSPHNNKDNSAATEDQFGERTQMPSGVSFKVSQLAVGGGGVDQDEDKDALLVRASMPVAKRRARAKGGFVVDSSDDE